MHRAALAVPVLLAALLRAVPLADPHLGLELQEKVVPRGGRTRGPAFAIWELPR